MTDPTNVIVTSDVEFVTGDLFRLGFDALGHGCNCVGAMGAGIAVKFREYWPEMYTEYHRRCKAGEFILGGFYAYDTGRGTVYNLGTQPRPGPCASLDAIESSVAAALKDCETRGREALAVPRLGSGFGGLNERDVEQALARAKATSPTRLVVVTQPPRR